MAPARPAPARQPPLAPVLVEEAPRATEPRPTERLGELDGLRGLAALSVVLNHCLALVAPLAAAGALVYVNLPVVGHLVNLPFLRSLPLSPAQSLLLRSPARVVADGAGAVLLFFLLSGFVLTLPFLAGGVRYRDFLVRRFFRLYPPYLGAVLLAMLAAALLAGRLELTGSGWVTSRWVTAISPGVLLAHLGMIGSFDNNQYDPVLWSLVHEARISLVFPLLMLVTLKLPGRWVLPAALGFSVVAWGFGETLWVRRHWDYGQTLEYLPIFVVGALLARHRVQLCLLAKRVGVLPLGAIGVLLYTYPDWFRPGAEFAHPTLGNLWAATSGAALLVICALASVRFGSVLRSRPVAWLGRVSYSLYLLHAVILLAIVRLLPRGTPLALVWIVGVALALLAAHLFQIAVEGPSNRFGRRLVRLLGRPQPADRG